jgi:hypothetical protein
MSRIMRLLVLAGAVLVALAGAAAGSGPAQATQSGTTFSGQATVVRGTIVGITVPCVAGPSGCSGLVDTGPVSPAGGDLEQKLVCYPQGANCLLGAPDMTNGAVQATVLHAAVVSHGSNSSAEASTAEFGLTALGHTVQAEFVRAQAEARCTAGTASVSGAAEVADLTIDGQTIAVSGQANQQVPIPGTGGFVIINEQIASASGDNGDITVNALHVVLPGPLPGSADDTDVVVAQAHADIMCGRPAGCPGDRVTGGGWFDWPAGGNRVHFALAARNGIDTWGHLLYMDKAQNLTVRGAPTSSALTWTRENDGTGTVEGTASANRPIAGQNVGYFVVGFVDAGEPGHSDKFGITLLTQQNGTVLYQANASLALTLVGGNLQYHHCR